VLTSDVNNSPEQNLGYHALVNFDGLSDTMLMLRFNPKTEVKHTMPPMPRGPY